MSSEIKPVNGKYYVLEDTADASRCYGFERESTQGHVTGDEFSFSDAHGRTRRVKKLLSTNNHREALALAHFARNGDRLIIRREARDFVRAVEKK